MKGWREGAGGRVEEDAAAEMETEASGSGAMGVAGTSRGGGGRWQTWPFLGWPHRPQL